MSSQIKVAARLSLAIAIVSTIMAVPFVGWVVDLFFAIPSIAVIILSIITLVMVSKAQLPKLSIIFSLVAGILGALAVGVFYVFGTGGNGLSLSTYDNGLVGGLYFLIAFLAWVAYIVSAIFNYINFSKVNRQAKELENNQQGQSLY